jgi:hypothetical protein
VLFFWSRFIEGETMARFGALGGAPLALRVIGQLKMDAWSLKQGSAGVVSCLFSEP